MSNLKLIPGLFLAGTMIVSGAALATAQSAENAEPEAPVVAADERPHAEKPHMKEGGRKDRGHAHGDRHGPGKFGKRGHHKGGFGPGGNPMMQIFAEIDADGDKQITQEDINSYRDGKVASADTSGDGALSIEEFDTLYREFTRERMVDVFQNFDANGDGTVTTAELDARFGNVVDRMDRDGDGVLTLTDRAPKR